jgi:hypothetical protein
MFRMKSSLGFFEFQVGYSKSVLEPVVRQAFGKFGLRVLEPEEYDVSGMFGRTDEESGTSAVGDVEGSEGAINVDKLRQLLDYVESEENEGPHPQRHFDRKWSSPEASGRS